MLKAIAAILLALVPAMTGFARERGAPIFPDSFGTKDTFAENRVVGKGWAGRINSADGKLLLPQGGTLQMRRETPAEFWLEMDITVNGPVEGASSAGDAFFGILIEGLRLTITHQGHSWVASSPEGSAENLVPERLLSLHGVRSLSADEPMYDPEVARGNPSNWLGPIWGIANYICWTALQNGGHGQLAETIATFFTNLLAEDLSTSGRLHECYSPETGRPIATPGFISWNALAALSEEAGEAAT